MPQLQLRGSGQPDRILYAYGCWEALLWVACLSQSKRVVLAWGIVCLTASWLALYSNPGLKVLRARLMAMKALGWASSPFVVSWVSDYCGSCVPPRRSKYGSDWRALLGVYMTTATAIAIAYSAVLMLLAARRRNIWTARLAAWGSQCVHLAAALSPIKGVDSAFAALPLLGVSIWHTLLWTYAFEYGVFEAENPIKV